MNIDERLSALTTSLELLDIDVRATTKNVDRLREIAERHDREIARFHRVLLAAMQAYLEDEGRNGEETQG